MVETLIVKNSLEKCPEHKTKTFSWKFLYRNRDILKNETISLTYDSKTVYFHVKIRLTLRI